jgi:hypothetical protein
MFKLLAGAAAIVAMAIPASVSAHGGPPADVFTETATGTVVVPFQGPCGGGGPGLATLEFHDTFHVTGFGPEDGHYAVTGNQVGSFSFEPVDPSEPSSTGRYRDGFHDRSVQNGAGFTSVLTVVGRDENGEHFRFQIRENYVFANGEMRVESFDVSC